MATVKKFVRTAPQSGSASTRISSSALDKAQWHQLSARRAEVRSEAARIKAAAANPKNAARLNKAAINLSETAKNHSRSVKLNLAVSKRARSDTDPRMKKLDAPKPSPAPIQAAKPVAVPARAVPSGVSALPKLAGRAALIGAAATGAVLLARSIFTKKDGTPGAELTEKQAAAALARRK